MNRWTLSLIVALFAALAVPYVLAQDDEAAAPAEDAAGTEAADAADAGDELMTVEQRLSYISGYQVGMQVGGQLSQSGIEADMDALVRGVQDALDGAEPALTREQVMQAVTKLQERQQKRLETEAAKNKKEGQAFLAKNKQREGVMVTESGLQYEVVDQAPADEAGPSPDANDEVTVHYEGTLLDGTVFDSSYERGEPITFPLNGVIKGWSEGVQLMNVGDKYKFYIPGDLAYDQSPRSPGGPGSTLIFTVELLGVDEVPDEQMEGAGEQMEEMAD